MTETTWQYLQISDVLDQEFSSALSEITPVLAWQPIMSFWGCVQRQERDVTLSDPPVQVCQFPLQRGFSRPPVSWLARFGKREASRIAKRCTHPEQTPLVCSTPYLAAVAEHWPGPVVYYLTDLIAAYEGADPSLVRKFDRKMCRKAKLVCPNSTRIADYLVQEAGCSREKIQVIPNATRKCNLLLEPSSGPGRLPFDLAGMPRPIAGIIGNLSANMDWMFLKDVIEANPIYSWAFVGPITMEIADAEQRAARDAVRNLKQARFVGRKSYGDLAAYARSFDVAVLPYRKREPTFSGSSTRFYEHLAAGRPMIATMGFEELLSKQPLLTIVKTVAEATAELGRLRACGFNDGHARDRWMASQQGTWNYRALTMYSALQERLATAAQQLQVFREAGKPSPTAAYFQVGN